ncbi:MAG: ABC transporter ATP-binding protein [Limnochordia bacterium]|nr:ABC transporter ATP-binding protein [Limnochordia bacterium]MDD2629662.1 ABC transporter ATP-binding protein [Limnochordia bacterium]MDD4518554.1 ABC transporter ATP-binding protein [Limnochordia bacterium]
MNSNIIEIRGLQKTYPGFQLGPWDLDIPQGAIVGLIGENGAGKSVTIKLILELIYPEQGEIRIFGRRMGEDPVGIRDQLGVVFDELHLSSVLTVAQIQKICRRMYRQWQDATFDRYVRQFDLMPDKAVGDLSRGMKMKLSLAIALSHGARLLLLDEATSGLDPVVREEILDILLEFIQDERRGVLISSHILSDLEKAADYIAFIHEGRLIFMESKDLLQDEYVLCSCNSQTAQTIDPAAIVGHRKNEFGERLLLRKTLAPRSLELERPSIEDIMLFFIKGGQSQ